MNSDIQFEIQLFHDFPSAESHWRKFEIQSKAFIFQSYQWLSCWFQCLAKRDSLTPCLVLVSVDNQPCMFLPLALKTKWGLVGLTWLGGDMSDFHCPLINPDSVPIPFADLWSGIEAKLPAFDVIHFVKQPEKIAGLSNPFLSLPGRRIQNKHYYSILEKDWEEFSQRKLSAKFRSDLRRRRKLLQRQGHLSFVIAETDKEYQLLIDFLIQQKSKRYRETGAYDIFQHPEYQDFLKTPLLADFDLHNNIHLSALKLNQQIIAVHWGMVYRDRFYHYMPSINRSWSKYAPGKLLLQELFTWSLKENLKVFDFTIGDEPYKEPWSTHQEYLFQTLLIKNRKGLVWAVIENIKDWVRNNPFVHQQINKLRNSNRLSI